MKRAKRLTRRNRAKPVRASGYVEMGINDLRPDGTQFIMRWPSDHPQTTEVGNGFRVIHPPGADVSGMVAALAGLSKQ